MMSIFDNHASPESIEGYSQKLLNQKKLEELICNCIVCGVHCLEVEDVAEFGRKVEEYVSLSHTAISDLLKRQQGRPVIRWDVRSFKKHDAIGSLYYLSQRPKSPKPIVIIENITEIPEIDDNIHDDPKLIENLLLHNWKNESSTFDDVKFGHFEIRPDDYSILITWSAETAEKMKHIWRASDGFAWCGRWPEE